MVDKNMTLAFQDLQKKQAAIEFMKRHFDGKCQGSVEYLRGTTLEELCRNTR